MNTAKDRRAIVQDLDYFLREATRRAKLLARLDLDGRNELRWKQIAALAHQGRVATRETIRKPDRHPTALR